MEGGGPPPPKKTVEKVLSFELKVLAQPPGSAAGLPCEAASAKNGSRPPNEEGEYPISNKEYPTSKCFGLKVKDSTHILHLSFSESDKCFTVPLFGKNERSTKK